MLYRITLVLSLAAFGAATAPRAAHGQALTLKGGGTPLTITGGGAVYVVGDLQTAAATTLQNNGTLQLTGSMSSAGTLAASLGTLRLSGTTAQSLNVGTATVGTLEVANTGPGAAGTVTLNGGTIAVREVLRLSSGTLALNGTPLTLLSDASGTALVVNEGTSVATGNTATMQRYLTTTNLGPGYRHYASPVSGNTVADLTTPGFLPVVNPAYNTSTRPLNVLPFPNVFGYDQARLATTTNNLDLFSKGWVSPAALSTPLMLARGYSVNIAGTEKVDFTGTLNTGDYVLPLARNSGATAPDAGWHHVGNPYPAPLDWTALAPADRPNLDGAMYVYESSSQYGGAYRTYQNGIGNASPLIGSSQGFWVRVSQGQTSGSITFRNAQRKTSYADQVPVARGANDLRPLVQLTLSGAGAADDVFIYAEAGATPGLEDTFDAMKLLNPSGLSVAAVVASGELLSIQGLGDFTTPTLVPLTLQLPRAGTYHLSAPTLAHLPPATRAVLVDNLTGARTDLHALPAAGYAFTAPTTSVTGRFYLNLVPNAAPLASAAGLLDAQVLLYPVPAKGHATLVLPAHAKLSAPAQLLNALGQVVRTLPLRPGQQETVLDLTGLATGVYLLRLPLDAATLTRRLLVD